MQLSNPAGFLCPDGFAPPATLAFARETSLVSEASRYAATAVARRRRARTTSYVGSRPTRTSDPVVLVPGFLAGDSSLTLMAADLRRHGLRTYRSDIRSNVGCTIAAAERLEARLEAITLRRGSRVQLVGHSLGGMLSRGIAARRPDLVSGVVTLGSPMLAPGAHHPLLTGSLDVLVRLGRAGLPGLMSAECVAGACAQRSFQECRAPLSGDTTLTCLFSRRDGVVDWHACLDPAGRAVEVRASHLGMAVDPRVFAAVRKALMPLPVATAAASRPSNRSTVDSRVASRSALDVQAVVGA